MPNLKSSKKRMRQSEKLREANGTVRSRIVTARRAFLEAVSGKDQDTAAGRFRTFTAVLDKAAKHGVIHKNKADRSKQRAAAKLAALGAAGKKA